MKTIPIKIKNLGLQNYASVWQDMQTFTNQRNPDTEDELWVVEHPAVFTLGQAGKPEHILRPGNIPVIETDRGGQVTYHGPGQLVIYLLLNLRRRKLGVKAMVKTIETAIIRLLSSYGIDAECRDGAPGVYVADKKIAALGLRVRQGCSYHGLSLNVDMDLEPFSRINPCGYVGLEVTQMADLVDQVYYQRVAEELVDHLKARL